MHKRFLAFSLIGIGVILIVVVTKGPAMIRPFAEDLLQKPLRVPGLTCPVDKDQDGLDDLQDFVAGAKTEVQRKPQYRSVYYQGGYPPEPEGVCTDVIWRAFRDGGYDLKALVDADIRGNLSLYPVGISAKSKLTFAAISNLNFTF